MPYLGQFLIGASFVLLLKRLGQDEASLMLVFLGVFSGLLVLCFKLSGLQLVVLANFSLAASFVGIGLILVGFWLPADISYGLYLYHMPVLNMLLIVFRADVSAIVVLLYFLVSFSLSVSSWFFLEKPCLLLRKKLA